MRISQETSSDRVRWEFLIATWSLPRIMPKPIARVCSVWNSKSAKLWMWIWLCYGRIPRDEMVFHRQKQIIERSWFSSFWFVWISDSQIQSELKTVIVWPGPCSIIMGSLLQNLLSHPYVWMTVRISFKRPFNQLNPLFHRFKNFGADSADSNADLNAVSESKKPTIFRISPNETHHFRPLLQILKPPHSWFILGFHPSKMPWYRPFPFCLVLIFCFFYFRLLSKESNQMTWRMYFTYS